MSTGKMMSKDTANAPDSSPHPGALTIKEHDQAKRARMMLYPTAHCFTRTTIEPPETGGTIISSHPPPLEVHAMLSLPAPAL
ncbi:MAG: hypothetical protein L0177_17785, partial [Chloroflexi bacterium]|nr:hypothetical protein [Chloroflexota bacterium]